MTIARLTPLLAFALAAALSAACAGPSANVRPEPAATGAPTPAPAAVTAVAGPSPTAAPQGTTPGGMRFEIVSAESTARYRAEEQLVGRGFNVAIGQTKAVAGAVVLGPNNQPIAEQSKILVDLRNLTSDDSRRDQFVRTSTLRTNQFPNAEFVLREIRGLSATLPTSGQQNFEVVGDLSVAGITKPMTWSVTALFTPEAVTGQATTILVFPEFGLAKPQVPIVLSIDDKLGLELEFKLVRAR